MEDKRKSHRVKDNPVVLYRFKNARLASGARVTNISEKGTCIPSKRPFPLSSLLELEIRSDNLREPLKVMARVVRISNLDNSEYQFAVGVEFFDIPVSQRRTLRDYIHRTMSQ